jgi:uncharacterized protein YcfL
MNKRAIIIILGLLVIILFAGCSTNQGVSQADFDTVILERDSLRDALLAKTEDYDELVVEYEQLKSDAEPFLKLTADKQAAELARAEQERIEAEEEARLAQEEADRLATERAEQEAEEARLAEEKRLAEEARGYETGITFDNISRSPDDYIGKKVKFSGRIAQVIEGGSLNALRMSTSGNYNNVIYGTYSPSIIDVRLLEDDDITIYGTVVGLKTYTTIMGASVTLPEISIDRIELR